MREGFEQDDIYIMVEDQFQSIAQSFTRHLHKAEYRRLTEQAKKQKASTIHDISRPTDAFTAMRAETMKMKEARELSGRQKKGLRDMRVGTGRPSQKGAEDDSDIEKDKADDPWVGTSLHGLMASPRKSQQALVGLQGVKSATRAAAGFAKSQVKPRMERRGLMDLDLSKEPSSHVAQEDPITIDEEEITSADEDDLDTLPSQPSKTNKARVSVNQEKGPLQRRPPDPGFFKSFAVEKSDVKVQNLTKGKGSASVTKLEGKTKSVSKPVKKFWLDDFDDLPSEPKDAIARSQEVEIQKVTYKPRHQAKSDKRPQPQTTAIPTFLV